VVVGPGGGRPGALGGGWAAVGPGGGWWGQEADVGHPTSVGLGGSPGRQHGSTVWWCKRPGSGEGSR
jgi:hypothetical protein